MGAVGARSARPARPRRWVCKACRSRSEVAEPMLANSKIGAHSSCALIDARPCRVHKRIGRTGHGICQNTHICTCRTRIFRAYFVFFLLSNLFTSYVVTTRGRVLHHVTPVQLRVVIEHVANHIVRCQYLDLRATAVSDRVLYVFCVRPSEF